jgi:hypothetical protein
MDPFALAKAAMESWTGLRTSERAMIGDHLSVVEELPPSASVRSLNLG